MSGTAREGLKVFGGLLARAHGSLRSWAVSAFADSQIWIFCGMRTHKWKTIIAEISLFSVLGMTKVRHGWRSLCLVRALGREGHAGVSMVAVGVRLGLQVLGLGFARLSARLRGL